MLSSKANFLLKSSKAVRVIFSSNFSTPQTFQPPPAPTAQTSEKPKREPFMKNVFLGIVDDTFFQFPDPKTHERSKNFLQLIRGATECLGKEHIGTNEKSKMLIESGLSKCKIPQDYGGLNLSSSELLYLYEQLNLNPSLSVLLETQLSLILRTILDHGSDEIKEKYLTKLVTGAISGAYAMSEECGGSDPTSLKTSAEEEDDCYKLNGEKVWVTNGEYADFFIVFANSLTGNNPLVKDLSVFLVEKSEGVYIEKQSLLGLNDCGLCKLKLKNVTVPKSHLIGKIGGGYQLAGDGLRYHKDIILICILNHLKYFLSSVINYVSERKQFPVDLKDCELVKYKLAEITRTIYSFESMLYLTSGICDQFAIDDMLESAILQLYGLEKGIDSISQCMHLLGSRAYDVSYPFEGLWRDLKCLSLSTKTVDIIKLYISLLGIDHAGNKLKDIVIKNRNPFNFPGFVFRRVLSSSRHTKDKPKLHLKLYMNLHPSLKLAADQLEYCILRLQYAVETVLVRHGSEIVKRQLELVRIAEVACDIYSMVAVLSRSSKAYCTGVPFCDQEVAIANACCCDSLIRIKKNVSDILNADRKQIDIRSFGIASKTLSNSYFFEHPLKPNIV